MSPNITKLGCTAWVALLALSCSAEESSETPGGPSLAAEWILHFEGGGVISGAGSRLAARPDGSAVFTATAPGPWTLYGSSKTSSGDLAGAAVVLAPDGTSGWSLPWGFRVAADAQADVVLVGSFVNSIDLGGGALDASGVLPNAVAAKFSGVDGQHLWSRAWGGDGAEQLEHVEVDASGDLIVAGKFSASISFGGPTLTGNPDGRSAALVAKYAGAGGEHVWSRRLADTEVSDVWDIAVDANGDAFVVGVAGTSAALGAVTIWKLSGATGADLWKITAPNQVTVSAIALSASGMYVAGSVASISGEIAWGSASLSDPNGGGAPFVAALEPGNGDVRWARTLADDGSAEDVTVSATSVFVIGDRAVTHPSGTGLLHTLLLWSCSPDDGRTFDDFVWEGPTGGWLTVDAQGRLWAAGAFEGTVETELSPPLVASGLDAFVMRFGG